MTDRRGPGGLKAVELSGGQAAAALLWVSQVQGRARDVRNRTWLVPVVLGIPLILGTRVNRNAPETVQVIRGCAFGLEARGHAACARAVSPVGTVVPTGNLSPHGSFWAGGPPPAFWAHLTNVVLWNGVVVAGLLLLLGMRVGRTRTLTSFRAGAGLLAAAAAAVLAGILMRLDPAVAPLTDITVVGVAISVIIISERSTELAIVGNAFALTALLASHLMSHVVIAGIDASFTGPSMSQLLAGVVLLAGGAAMRWGMTSTTGITLDATKGLYQLSRKLSRI